MVEWVARAVEALIPLVAMAFPIGVVVAVLEGLIPTIKKMWERNSYKRDVRRCLQTYRNY